MWHSLAGASCKFGRVLGNKLFTVTSAPLAAAAAQPSRLPLPRLPPAALPGSFSSLAACVGRTAASASSRAPAGPSSAAFRAAQQTPRSSGRAASSSSSAPRRPADEAAQSLTTGEDAFGALTDKIPEPPVTAAETASYSLIIVAGLGVAVAAAWAVLKELVFEPKEYTVFGLALDACRAHAVVQTRLGSPLSGYGVESSSRSQRQRIRHKLATDAQGRETVTVQFQLRGPRGVGTVLAEGVRDAAAPGGYRLNYVQCQDAHGHMRPIHVVAHGEQAIGGVGAAAGMPAAALGRA